MKEARHKKKLIIWFHLYEMSRKANLDRQKVGEWLSGAQNVNRNEGLFWSDGNVLTLNYSVGGTTLYLN